MILEVKSARLQCTADELRQSNALADSMANMLRGIFNPMCSTPDIDDDGEDTDEDQAH